MIINSQLVAELLKQEPREESEVKKEIKSEEAMLDKFDDEDCNNNLNNTSNRNILEENFKFQHIKQHEAMMENYSFQTNRHSTVNRCTGCQLVIEDKYVFNLMNTYWHEDCLQCSQCRVLLKKTCFFKNGLLFCKDDYLKQFGTRCNGCYELISSNELVMRFITNSNTEHQQLLSYHLNCFKCVICERLLQKGDEFVLKKDGIYCKHDHEFSNTASHSALINRLNSKPTYPFNSSLNTTALTEEENSSELSASMHRPKQTTPRKSSSSRRITKRPRTILNAVQRYDFREAFKQSPKPCRKVREHLASKTGLSVRVVQVWFQNERAKVKKMQRRQQQHLLNQKLNGKKGINVKMNSNKLKRNKKVKSNRKTIDSDLNELNSEENSLAAEDDDFDEFDDDESDQSSSDDVFDESDEDIEEDDEEDEDEELNKEPATIQSPNITTNTSSSSSSSTSSSDFNNSFMIQHGYNQHAYNLPAHNHFQQQQQIVHNSPIDRLYSMQNLYFCSS